MSTLEINASPRLRKRWLLTLLLSLFMAAPASRADAQPTGLWTFYSAGQSAIACTPMAPVPFTSTTPAYQQTHGKVYHRGTSLESITLFCSVNWSIISLNANSYDTHMPETFSVRYRDPDGTSGQAQVQAALKYVDNNGNVVTMASLDSNTQSATGVTSMSTSIAENQWSALHGRYYVQLSIKRSSTGLLPEVIGYDLQ